jgi:RNA polymerase sigma-70 factor (ECF subfamily)
MSCTVAVGHGNREQFERSERHTWLMGVALIEGRKGDGDMDIGLVQVAGRTRSLSFETIFETYRPAISRYLTGMVRDAALAEDLCQDTFVSAYKAVPNLHDEAQLAPWLYRIATNKAISALRRKRLIAWVPFDLYLHDRSGRRDIADDVAAGDAVARALDRLPHDQVACLLGHAEGLTYADLSQTLDCSLAAVKQRLYRARLAFRSAYAAETREAETIRDHKVETGAGVP